MKIKTKKAMVVFSIAFSAGVIYSTTFKNNNNSFYSAHAICAHKGNHYLERAATTELAGCKEYWVCCLCHEHFVVQDDNVTTGTWTDAGTATLFDDGSEDVLDNRFIDKEPAGAMISYAFKLVTSIDEISGDENDEYCIITREKDQGSYYSCEYNGYTQSWLSHAISYSGSGNLTGDVGQVFHITKNNKDDTDYVIYSIIDNAKKYATVAYESSTLIQATDYISSRSKWNFYFNGSSIDIVNRHDGNYLYMYYCRIGNHLMDEYDGLYYGVRAQVPVNLYKRVKIVRYNLNNCFSWANNLSGENVTMISQKTGQFGAKAGDFINISYYSNKEDILSLFSIFKTIVEVDSTYKCKQENSSYVEYTYFTESGPHSFVIENGKYIYSNELANPKVYVAKSLEPIPESVKPTLTCHSFVVKSPTNSVEVDVIGTPYRTYIDYLDKIIFTEWGNEPMDNNDAKYVINDPAVAGDYSSGVQIGDDGSEIGFDNSSSIYIYDANRFSCRNVFYRVVSEQNFSSLFAS